MLKPKNYEMVCMVVHVYNLSLRESEVGRLQVWSQAGLCSETNLGYTTDPVKKENGRGDRIIIVKNRKTQNSLVVRAYSY